jgi:hypothetical protein
LIEFGTWKIVTDDNEITVMQYVLEEMDELPVETFKYKTVYDFIKREFVSGNIYETNFFIAHDDEKISSVAIELLAQPYSLSDNWWNKYKIIVPGKKEIFIKDIASSVIRFKQYRVIAELKKIENKIRETNDEAELIKLMKLNKLLNERKKEFAQIVGNVIYRPTT